MSYYASVNFYDLLEVDIKAGRVEIEAAYRRQLDMVSGNALATYGLFVGEDVVSIRQRLEEAFHVLSDPQRRRAYDLETFKQSFVSPDMEAPETPVSAGVDADDNVGERRVGERRVAARRADDVDVSEGSAPQSKPTPRPATAQPVLPELTVFDGPSLRTHREARGLTLEIISARTKIAQYYLDYIEAERFESLPPGIYLRSYLQQYARAIGADPEKLVVEYLARRETTEGQ